MIFQIDRNWNKNNSKHFYSSSYNLSVVTKIISFSEFQVTYFLSWINLSFENFKLKLKELVLKTSLVNFWRLFKLIFSGAMRRGIFAHDSYVEFWWVHLSCGWFSAYSNLTNHRIRKMAKLILWKLNHVIMRYLNGSVHSFSCQAVLIDSFAW